jgi:hypothetical protein
MTCLYRDASGIWTNGRVRTGHRREDMLVCFCVERLDSGGYSVDPFIPSLGPSIVVNVDLCAFSGVSGSDDLSLAPLLHCVQYVNPLPNLKRPSQNIKSLWRHDVT